MVRLFSATLVAVAAFSTAVAADDIVRDCGVGYGKCPSNKPCCSQYGQCGVGAFCLGGCDPRHSTSLDSCVPAPVCQSKKSTFTDGKNVVNKREYLGDASKADWVAEGAPVVHNSNLLLTMPRDSVGTVLASTHYVWYGKISATLKTSRRKGVVSSFITMSDMKDEIDFEWVGKNLEQTETNYYFQGIPDYTHGGKTKLSDTYENWHNYEIDWTPDSVTWSIDGQVARVLNKKETYNSTTKRYDFPQTPSRVQLSLWPGGLPANGEGTIEWAGGLIDWDQAEDGKYYYVTVKDISIECYDPPSGSSTGTSYTYKTGAGYEDDVVIGNNPTVLKSFLATGTDMELVPKGDAIGEDIETIPGLSGAGTGTHSVAQQAQDLANSGVDPSSGATGSGARGGDTTTWSQGGDGTTGGSGAAEAKSRAGSGLAILVALAAVMML